MPGLAVSGVVLILCILGIVWSLAKTSGLATQGHHLLPNDTQLGHSVASIALNTPTPVPSLPPEATPTIVVANRTLHLQISSPQATSVVGTSNAISINVGDALVVDTGKSFALDHIIYDPFVIEPNGQGSDGSPRFVGVDDGATYLSGIATPICLHSRIPCLQTARHVTYLIEVGNLSGGRGAASIAEAQLRATALAGPRASLADEARQVAALATQAAAAPTATPCTFPCLPADEPGTPAGAGFIFPWYGAIFPGEVARTERNAWIEQKEGAEITVHAGAMSSGSSDTNWTQGAVFVQQSNRPVYQIDDYLTPTKDGSVRIASASGEQLTLVAKDGTTFIFDVPSRHFIAAPLPASTSSVIPTAAASTQQPSTATVSPSSTIVSSTQLPSTATSSPTTTYATQSPTATPSLTSTVGVSHNASTGTPTETP